MKSLNPNEILVGTLFGLAFCFKIGWLAILLAVATGLLWALGGAKKEDGGNKLYRRIGVPFLAAGVVAIIYKNYFAFVSGPLGFIVLSIGYGIPSTQPVDNGSFLGGLCFAICHEDERKAEFLCRTILYILLAIAFIPCWVAVR